MLLLWRIVPFFLYSVCIILLPINMLAFSILLCIFYALNLSLSAPCEEIILNYSSDDNYSKNLGITEFLTYLFSFLSVIIGGYLLDSLNSWIVSIISISLYAVSIIPLVIFYIKNKNSPTFNQELTTNAVELDKNFAEKQQVRKRLIVRSCLIMGLAYCCEAIYPLISFITYTKFDLFTISAIIYGLSDFMYGISSLVIGKFNETKDLSVITQISAFICAVTMAAIPFINNQIVLMLFVCILAICNPVFYMYLDNNMVQKTRILGISNAGRFYNTTTLNTTIASIGLIGLCGTLTPCFMVGGLGMLALSVFVVKHEEKSTDIMLKYFESINQQAEIKKQTTTKTTKQKES